LISSNSLIHRFRAGFHTENLLLYAPIISSEKRLALPIGYAHKFAPIALGDVAQVAAHVLSGKGEHGFDNKHRGQLITLTGERSPFTLMRVDPMQFLRGPMLVPGKELAAEAKEGLGVEMEFDDISA
jgi:hypothetical protein